MRRWSICTYARTYKPMDAIRPFHRLILASSRRISANLRHRILRRLLEMGPRSPEIARDCPETWPSAAACFSILRDLIFSAAAARLPIH